MVPVLQVTDERLKKMWTTVDAQSGQREDVKRETVYCLDDDNETEVQKDDTIQGERESDGGRHFMFIHLTGQCFLW